MRILVFCRQFALLVLIPLTSIRFLYAQEVTPSFRHFTSEDGLPSSEVYVVLQDHSGNMWFGTDRGATRYNGYEFRTFSYKDGLTDNTVFKLFEDKRNRLWMLTYSGRLFYFEGDKIIPFKYNDKLVSEFLGHLPYGLYVDSLENIFILIRDLGECKADTNGNFKWTFPNTDLPEVDYLVHEIAPGNTLISIMWPKNPAPLKRILFVKDDVLDSFSVAIPYGDRFSAVSLPGNKFIFALGRKLFEKSTGPAKALWDFPGNVYFLLKDKKNNLIAGTENGVFVFDPMNFNSYKHHYLEKNSVTNFLEDNEGGYWFTTIDNGIYYMTGYGIEGIRFDEMGLQKPISLTSDFKSSVYAGCWNGTLVRIHDRRINGMFHPDKDAMNTPITNLSAFPLDNKIYLSRTKPAWFSDGKFHFFKTESILGVKTNFLKRFDGSIFSAGSSIVMKVKNDSVVHYSYLSQRVNSLVETQKHELLFGCNLGVFVYNDLDKSIQTYRKELDNVRVDDIKWAGDKLVFATKGKGLLILVNDSIYKIDESAGLCSDLTNKIYTMQNDVWCITNKGISHIHFLEQEKFAYTISNIHNNDGLLSDEINDITRLNDTIYLATNLGISFFDERIDFVNHTKPPVHITSLHVNNELTKEVDDIHLKYDLNDINISFNGISYRSNEKLIYRYMLIKGKDTLSALTSNREVEFLSLHPGKYTFLVSARNSSGIWSESPASFSFIIQPAWWQTWWFRFVVLLVLVAGVFFLYRRKVKILKLKFETERRQAALQLTAMRAQMNPHFIFNVMNSIRNYMQNHDMKSAEKYLTSFSKLVRYTLDNSEVQEVTLEEELHALRNYVELERQRFDNGFEYNVTCEEGIDTKETMLLSMLLQPFVENSIKHGISSMINGGKILIDIRKLKDSILIAIEDNGIGFQKSKKWNESGGEKYVSHGTELSFERIKAYNKVYNKKIKTRIINLTGDDDKPAGTRVELEI